MNSDSVLITLWLDEPDSSRHTPLCVLIVLLWGVYALFGVQYSFLGALITVELVLRLVIWMVRWSNSYQTI